MRGRILSIILLIGILFLFNPSVYAHGVNIKYQANFVYEIQATFDNGQSISEGQVTIYAPNNPTEPWGSGLTDNQGRYSFTPDNIAGNWTIKVRQAGHGSQIIIPLGNEEVSLSGETGLTASQLIIMSISIVWGFIGTALYFKRRKE